MVSATKDNKEDAEYQTDCWKEKHTNSIRHWWACLDSNQGPSRRPDSTLINVGGRDPDSRRDVEAEVEPSAKSYHLESSFQYNLDASVL